MLIKLSELQDYTSNRAQEASAIMTLAIDVITDKINLYLWGDGYTTETATYTEVKMNGTGTNVLVFPGAKVNAITSIEYRTSATEWATLETSYYDLASFGAMGLGSFVFRRGNNIWRATWAAGWDEDSIPGAIKECALEECKRFMEARPDLQSKNMGGQASTGTSYIELWPLTKKKLDYYRKVLL